MLRNIVILYSFLLWLRYRIYFQHAQCCISICDTYNKETYCLFICTVTKVLYYYWANYQAYRADTNKTQGLTQADPTWVYGGKSSIIHRRGGIGSLCNRKVAKLTSALSVYGIYCNIIHGSDFVCGTYIGILLSSLHTE